MVFYVRWPYMCPRCMVLLDWEKRSDKDDSLVLVHADVVDGKSCLNSGKKFYAPVESLTEFKSG